MTLDCSFNSLVLPMNEISLISAEYAHTLTQWQMYFLLHSTCSQTHNLPQNVADSAVWQADPVLSIREYN